MVTVAGNGCPGARAGPGVVPVGAVAGTVVAGACGTLSLGCGVGAFETIWSSGSGGMGMVEVFLGCCNCKEGGGHPRDGGQTPLGRVTSGW